MSNTSQQVLSSFLKGEERHIRNDESRINYHPDGTCVLLLHGNVIASKQGDRILATLADWPTVTARSRLNAICQAIKPGFGFHQEKGKQYFHWAIGDGRSDRKEITPTEWVRLS